MSAKRPRRHTHAPDPGMLDYLTKRTAVRITKAEALAKGFALCGINGATFAPPGAEPSCAHCRNGGSVTKGKKRARH